MKPSVLLAAAASLAAAQNAVEGIPKCAQSCVNKYVSGNGIPGCKAADVACICKNKDFLDKMACCLSGVCSQADQDKTVQYAKQLCNAIGVTVPDKVECRNPPTGTPSAAEAAASASSSSSPSSASASAPGSSSSASATPSSGAGTFSSIHGVSGGLAGALVAFVANAW